MIGKMDSNGTILWVNTFGSSKNEIGQAICFNASKTSLVITGRTADSLVVNNIFIDKGEQSTLVAKFSLTGTLQSHKLHDFLPQRDHIFGGDPGIRNYGREISSDMTGNYFILTDREGNHSLAFDTLNASIHGRYITKLNTSLDTLWSAYISGPACYYGWDCKSLQVSSSGDPYTIGACSQKYGGDRFTQRLNKTNGLVAWSSNQWDGGSRDLFIEGSDLYTCGIDSADYCPCPSHYKGFATVKKFDQSNSMVKTLKFNGSINANNDIHFNNITRDGYGNSYLLGTFSSSMAVIGSDTLYPSFPNSTNHFIMKLSDNSIVTSVAYKEANNSFTIYPNPTTGVLELHFSGRGNESTRLNIVDVTGRTVYSEILQKGIFNKIIDLSKEAKGVYMIEATTGTEKNYKKVVIE